MNTNYHAENSHKSAADTTKEQYSYYSAKGYDLSIFFPCISSNVGVSDNNRITYYALNIGQIKCYSLEFKAEYFQENDLM